MEQPSETLRLERGELRRLSRGHAEDLNRAINESREHLMPWMPWAAGQDLQQTAEFLRRSEDAWEAGQAYEYAITSGGTTVGSCGLMRRIGPGGLDIGYWLHSGWTGRGLATTAVSALVDAGFGLPETDRMEIHHDAANHASAGVPRRLGFTEVGRVRVPEGPSAPGETGIDVTWRMLSRAGQRV